MSSDDTYPRLRVAAVQAAPVFGDVDATIDKVDDLVAQAKQDGADLVVFGECFVAGYPIWALVKRPVDIHPYFEEHFASGVEVPGRTCSRLAAVAAKHAVMLSIGVNERSVVSKGTMWNSNLIFNARGELVNHRRKLVGTFVERLLYAPGDAHGLEPVDLDGARIGVLICGENTNTLARFALLAQGETIHIATYPPCGVFQREAEKFDMGDAIRIRAAAHSFEGKVFTVAAATMPDDDAIARATSGDPEARTLLTSAPPSASMIIDPLGRFAAGPLVGTEGVIAADVDLRAQIAPKLMHDITGAYNRFDIFGLTVRRDRRAPIVEYGGDERDAAGDHASRAAEFARPVGAGAGAAADHDN